MGNKRNWRNPEDYEFTKRLPKDGWAWEFLRRNPEYQADWEQIKDFHSKLEPVTKKAIEGFLLSSFPESLFITSPPLPSSRKWGLMQGFVDPEIDISIFIEFKRTFGEMIPDLYNERLFRLGAPECFKELKKTHPDYVESLIKSGTERYRQRTVPEGCVAMTFDLSLPISPQVEYAKKMLIECQAKEKHEGKLSVTQKRDHTDNWTNYLRVWDAKNQNADQSEIASVIFPNYRNKYPDLDGNRMVRDTLKASENYIYGGYRKIVTTPPPLTPEEILPLSNF